MIINKIPDPTFVGRRANPSRHPSLPFQDPVLRGYRESGRVPRKGQGITRRPFCFRPVKPLPCRLRYTSSQPDHEAHVLIFGLVGGLLIATLQYTEYRFVIIEHSVEVYGALVAILFAAFGIWLGLRITRRRETTNEIVRETVVVKEVLVPAEAPAPSFPTRSPSLPTRPNSRTSASRRANSKSSPWLPAA